MSDVLDHTQYWWGLTWSALLDIDNMSQEQEQKLYVDFQKAQYSLLHVMSDNFGSHEKQIIADHDPVTLVGKLTQKTRSIPNFGMPLSVHFPTGQDGRQRPG
jgi:hypothetical protein